MLNSIMREFSILVKVTGVVTDNGSNYVKAFRVFGPDKDGGPAARAQVEAIRAEIEAARDGLDYAHLDDIMSEVDEAERSLVLPKHFCCVAHTLNLVATRDSEAALSDREYKKVSRSTEAKLRKVWSQQNQSTKFSDFVHQKMGYYFIVPVVTR